MATYTASFAPDMTSDATFRTIVQGIITGITTIGWVDTGATGSINTTTVTRPGAANTAAGFSVFTANDTLSASYPIFIKVEYGTGSLTSTFAIWVTVGTAHDGAGTLTGIILDTRQQIYGASSTTANTCYFSGNTGRLAMVLWATQSPVYVGVERTRDTSGNTNSDGIIITKYGASTPGWKAQLLLYAAGVGNVTTNLFTIGMSRTNSSQSFGGSVGVSPHFPYAGRLYRPGINLMVGGNSDFTTATLTNTIPIYGTNRNYACWKLLASPDGSNLHATLVLWE